MVLHWYQRIVDETMYRSCYTRDLSQGHHRSVLRFQFRRPAFHDITLYPVALEPPGVSVRQGHCHRPL